ncbi:MAG: hypothetical protein ACO3IB_00165 [Phycisphaerales bacterium]
MRAPTTQVGLALRIPAGIALVSMCALLASCQSGGRSAPRRTTAVTTSMDFGRNEISERIGAEELNSLTNAYADRYRTLLEDAVAAIVDSNPDARQRALAQRLLVESTSSIYDIATNGDPFSQVLDLTISVTLTSRVWIDEDRAEREFGTTRAMPLVLALRQARKEIWEIAALVLTQDRLSALDFMIEGWRRDNRGVEDVSYVRFNDFAAERGASLVTEAATGAGGLFEPLDKAVEQAKSYERLVERMFFLVKRAPTLINWQSQAVIDGVLAKDEVRRSLANLDGVSRSVEALTKTTMQLAEDLPKIIAREREAVFVEIERRQQDIDDALAKTKEISADAAKATADVKATLEGVQPVLMQAESTLKSLEPTIGAVERLALTSERLLAKVAEIKGPPTPPDPNAPPAKPFDIADYERTLREATTTLVEVNKTLERGESLAGSPAVKSLIDQVTVATEERISSLESAATRLAFVVAGLSAVLVVLGFVMAILYRRLGGSKGEAA